MSSINSANRALDFLEDFTRNPDRYDRKQVEAVFKVRTLADRIECLPDQVNSPSQMPFVQEALRGAFERFRSLRNALATGYEPRGDLREAERLRQPVEFVLLDDDEKRVVEEGFERDESGIFEEIERDAAEIGEWLKEFRHPRDAEKFREYLNVVCGPSGLISSIGIEVRPGVFALDLDAWKEAGATPLCDYLRELADEMATELNADAGEGMLLLTKATRIFAFKSPKALMCFLDRHPEVKQGRPLTKAGKPHPRQRTVSVLGITRAISRDDAIMSDPVRKKRMESRLKQAKFNKDLEDSALAYLGWKR